MKENSGTQLCERCGSGPAFSYEQMRWGKEARVQSLCIRCARSLRRKLQAAPEVSPGLTRGELIAMLDRFFAASGVFEICGRCHAQGTGCCPPTCRVMGATGCDPNNRYGKTVFCAAFVCSALLNAISECDPDIGRELKRIKNELGPAEYRIYEMITRVPAAAREPVRPLTLPKTYPAPPVLDGAKLREQLLALADEILEIRRRWRPQELSE
jgi:hypothetical protein